MKIRLNGFNKPTFKGQLIVPMAYESARVGLNTDKISKFEKRDKLTLIYYDEKQECMHNGVKYYEPAIFETYLDFNTLLNAYNAAKNSQLTVEADRV